MKLSVMMITYNHELFISQALQSVLAQQVNFDFEVLVGEDCSTDHTREILMDFHSRYPGRIVPVLRDRNLGVMLNFQQTLAACRGQYVAMLEGDDYWTCDQKLQKQVDFLDAHPDFAMCSHRVQFLNESSSKVSSVFPSLPAGPYTIRELLQHNFVMTSSTLLRRDRIPPIPDWFSKMKMGDWPLFVLVARNGNIQLLDEIMATYRVHSGGIWSSLPRIVQLRECARMLRVLDKHFGFQYTDFIRDQIARPYLELAIAARRDGRRADTAKNLVSCLRNGGWQFRGSRRTMAALAAYALVGPSYKAFSRSKS